MYTVAGKHIAIIGAARSGIAAARMLSARGAEVFVSDAGRKEALEGASRQLYEARIAHEIGAHSQRAHECEIMVLSPGVPSDAPVIRSAMTRNIEIVSELEMASRFFEGDIIAVTGSNGKTTTTSLAGAIFERAGVSSVVAGNIGTAFSLSVMPGVEQARYAILEVSSFQLDYITSFKPRVAVITNVTPDHLDRYDGSFEKYMRSKMRIFANQDRDGYLVMNADDPHAEAYTATAPSQRIACSIRNGGTDASIEGDDAVISVPGKEPVRIGDLQSMLLQGPVHAFKGVEHRLEFVREHGGVLWYNDSKATNVDSAITALGSFSVPVIWIAGGKEKGAPYDPLKPLVQKHVKLLILIGEARNSMARAFEGDTEIAVTDTLEAAVALAHEQSASGDAVVLSPACASFDMFDNYEHRGRAFKHAVEALS